MLTDKENLLLCELVNHGAAHVQAGYDLEKAARVLEDSTGSSIICLALSKEILASPRLSRLQLRDRRKLEKLELYFFTGKDEASWVQVVVVHAPDMDNLLSYSSEGWQAALPYLEPIAVQGCLTLTGLKVGGYFAVHIAASLEAEAVVFGVPSTEKLPGKVRNLVSEHDPVGTFTDKLIFVKQKTPAGAQDESYFESLEFDECGKALAVEQSDYSKFVSWFYHTAYAVRPEVWRHFFGNTGEAELLNDLGLYAVLLQIDQLNEEKITRSLHAVLRSVEDEFKQNRSRMRLELEHIEMDQIKAFVGEFGESLVNRAVDLVFEVYRSVETILMGVGLFTLEKFAYPIVDWMGEFSQHVGELLDSELVRITETIEQELQHYMEEKFRFPELVLD